MGNIFYPDSRDFLHMLNKHNVRYLLVGGYAVTDCARVFYLYAIAGRVRAIFVPPKKNTHARRNNHKTRKT